MYRSTLHTSTRRSAVAFAALLSLVVSVVPSAAAMDATLTQRKINEIAGGVLSTHLALEGVSGNRAAGETDAAFSKRIGAYLASMDRAVKSLAPVRERIALRSTSKENEARWERIRGAAKRLPLEVAAFRKMASAKDSGRSMDPEFKTVSKTIWNIYAELRDAKP